MFASQFAEKEGLPLHLLREAQHERCLPPPLLRLGWYKWILVPKGRKRVNSIAGGIRLLYFSRRAPVVKGSDYRPWGGELEGSIPDALSFSP